MSTAKLLGAATVLLSIIGVGCGQKSGNDQSLVTDIQSKLYADNTTRQANVTVAAKDGVVTLSGDVPSSDVELQAMKLANATAGVRRVDDQMKVNGAPGAMSANEPPAGLASTPGSALTGSASSPSNSAQNPAAAASAPAPAVNPAHTTPAPAVAESSRSENASAPEPKRKPAEPQHVTIPAGDRLSVRTADAIDSGKASVGQTFQASLDAPLTAEGRVIVPAGAPATLQIQSVKGAGRIKGSSELSVRVTSIEYRGKSYEVDSSTYADAGKARGKQTAVKTGVGAAAGAVIGAIAGGGKGAAIGSAAGGGAGFGWNALTHGEQVKIPSETVLTFKLAAPLTLPAPRQ
ncbi:MAG: BON domain-containing protein [Bryobacteraceae bacterium]